MCRKLLLQSQLQMQVGKRRFYEVRGDDTWRSATITQLNPGGTGEPTLVYTESSGGRQGLRDRRKHMGLVIIGNY